MAKQGGRGPPRARQYSLWLLVDSYETWVMIWRCGPATTHSHSAAKIITNVGEQPFGRLFGTLRPQMKTTRLSETYKPKTPTIYRIFLQRN
jgi:hypothetical protein